ncbi:MAG: hypothetical protein ACP5NV_01670 [Candidatus Woesearchaeota archaeon]
MTKPKSHRDEGSYFVSIKNPLETRRHLLESTKKSLMGLQGYHKLQVIRQEKQRHLESLKQSVKELMYLNTKLTQILPEYNYDIISEFKKEKHVEKKQPAKQDKKPVLQKDVARKEKTDLEKLEESLNSIEEKLKTLG